MRAASLASLLFVACVPDAEPPQCLPPPPPEEHVPAVTPPVVLTRVDAVTPPALEEPADVVLVIVVDVAGRVSKVEVATSGGAAVDDAAVTAVRRWTFVPAKRNGVPVASRIKVPFHFAASAHSGPRGIEI